MFTRSKFPTWFTIPIIILLLTALVAMFLPFQSSYIPNGNGENSPNMGYDRINSYSYEWFLPWMQLSINFLLTVLQLVNRKPRVILTPLITFVAFVLIGLLYASHRVHCCEPFIPEFKIGLSVLSWSSICLVVYLNVFAWRKE